MSDEKFVPMLQRIGVKGRLMLKVRMAVLRAKLTQRNTTAGVVNK